MTASPGAKPDPEIVSTSPARIEACERVSVGDTDGAVHSADSMTSRPDTVAPGSTRKVSAPRSDCAPPKYPVQKPGISTRSV